MSAQLIYDENDCASLALCAWREARGEGCDGMRAVMHVIVNRARRWYGGHCGHSESIHHAVYAKNQFTSMSVPTDPEFHLMPSPTDPQYAEIRNLSREVLSGDDPDITNGALYYVNPKTMVSAWFEETIICDPANHPETARIGHHVFYA